MGKGCSKALLRCARSFLTATACYGYGMLLSEYRGFGGNPGHPSEQGLYRDARAA